MSDLSRVDLGNGFYLVFQALQSSGGGKVRAVVKNGTGTIVARGMVVPEADAAMSKRDAVLAHMSNVLTPPPDNFMRMDFSNLGDDDDKDDEW
jgi:hypothetical protein